MNNIEKLWIDQTESKTLLLSAYPRFADSTTRIGVKFVDKHSRNVYVWMHIQIRK